MEQNIINGDIIRQLEHNANCVSSEVELKSNEKEVKKYE